MRIEKYNAGQLRAFLDSHLYRDMPFIPVTRHRAESWLRNPRMKPDDVLLYNLFDGEDLLAYRCVLPDRISGERFGWLSGVWVRPDHRRRGLARMLLEEAMGDWKGRLMLNNYAPAAAALALKGDLFSVYTTRVGRRFYLRSGMSVLLGNRSTLYHRSRLLLQLGDGLVNLVMDRRRRMEEKQLRPLTEEFEEVPRVDTQVSAYLESMGASGCSNRSGDEWNWVLQYPWVRRGRKDHRYAFTSVSSQFSNQLLKCYGDGDTLRGFFWIKRQGPSLSIPYTAWNRDLDGELSGILNHYLLQTGVSWFTTFHEGILEHFQPALLLGQREMFQQYLVTEEMKGVLPDPGNLRFQDGDGDRIFA